MLYCIEDNIERNAKEVGWEDVDWINLLKPKIYFMYHQL